VNYLKKVEQIKNNISPENFFELRYEDLIKYPCNELNNLCKFLDLEYSEAMLDYHQNKTDYKTDDRNQVNLKKPIIKAAVRKWRQEMSLSESQIFETIASASLQKYNYSFQENPFYFPYSKLIIDRFLTGPTKRLVAMMKNSPGHREALIYLLIKFQLSFWQPSSLNFRTSNLKS
jgi:hypothetical protein